MARTADPSFSLIDSQSVKTTDKAIDRGIDGGGREIKGRKRHIVTDTQGHLLHVKIHAANIHDTVGCHVFEGAIKKYPSLQGVCADAGYRKTMENFVETVLNKTIEISERITPRWTLLAKR